MENDKLLQDQSQETIDLFAPEVTADEIVEAIENSTTKKGRKRKRKNNKKKNAGEADSTQDQTDTDFASKASGAEEVKAQSDNKNVLTSVENRGDQTVKSSSNVLSEEAEETKDEIQPHPTKPSKKGKKKGKGGKKAPAQSAPKEVKPKACMLKRIEITDEFWKAYDSDATSGSSAESLQEYTKGGYHPVHVGETYNNRYRILKKLGWGAFSTVWFSHDMQQNKFVAIKIQKSGESYYSAAEDEIEILEVIAEKWKTEEWKDSISEYNEVNNINSCH